MNLEQSFINKISSHLLHYRFKGGETHQFCCPYCQSDGINSKGKKISESKAKGYFYQENGATNFKCHKCGTGKQFHNFLKDHFPNEFIAYVREREHMGTTGKGHNCPTLANALESIGGLKFEKPVFDKNENDDSTSTTARESSDSSKEDKIEGCGKPPKVQKLPPMRSPQQQSGCQAHINHLIKQKHERARRRRGDLW